MSFFENLGASLGGGAKTVVDKTKELSGVAAVKAQISSQEASLGKLYRDLGKAYYEANKIDAAFAEKIAEINAVKAKISELDAKLGDIQGTVRCEVCGEPIPKTSTFCPKCGAKKEASDEAVEEAPVVEETPAVDATEETTEE